MRGKHSIRAPSSRREATTQQQENNLDKDQLISWEDLLLALHVQLGQQPLKTTKLHGQQVDILSTGKPSQLIMIISKTSQNLTLISYLQPHTRIHGNLMLYKDQLMLTVTGNGLS